MNSLTSKVVVSLNILVVLTAGCTTTSGTDPESCVEGILNVDVVRVDEKNHRYFIAGSDIRALDVKEKLDQIEKCFVDTPWQPDWSLSVFTEAKYAGYKDEENIIPYHKDDEWAEAYIMEYDHSAQSLTKNPATRPEQLLP